MTQQHPVNVKQHPPMLGPPTTIYAAKALATPPIAPPPEVKQVEEKVAEEKKAPEWCFVYYFNDGQVSRTYGQKPDTLLMQQAHLVTVSVPSGHNQAPFVEVIKMRYGRGSLILSCNVPVQQNQQGGNDGQQGTEGIRR